MNPRSFKTVIFALAVTTVSYAQNSLNDIRKYFAKGDSINTHTPYTGIATSQGLEKGLYAIKSTGVATKPVVAAAKSFLAALSQQQLAKAKFPLLDEEWQRWCNVDNGLYMRQGISLKQMSKEQRDLAFKLMQSSLSAKGLQLSKDIMKTDQTLRELNNDDPIYDEDLYFFSIMGNPSSTDPWGWQIDGHHLVINYFVLKDQVVMTPIFMGGEPIVTTSGKYKGNIILQDEQNMGLTFMQSLSPEQQGKATLSTEKTSRSIIAEAFSDNKIIDYQGLQASELSDEQKNRLLELANQYVGNIEDGHAKVKMEEIRKHLDHTWFGWVGKTDDNAVFYYRIHSPVILIEFDHQGPIGIQTGDQGPTRNHIHTIVRTPNGNDYGKDLLRQHLETHHK